MVLPTSVHDDAYTLFRSLLRIDTTNPPGNERPAADCLADFLSEGGLDPVVLESAPGRANLVARIAGDGSLPPLLLAAHLDVVPADGAAWTRPPFAAEEHDGWLWGRGAVDMKNMAAMSAAIMCAVKASGVKPKRDLIFAAVADEEMGCDFGSGWLVDNHADRVRAEYALGEVGAFSMHVMGRTFYPVQVAEKGIAWLRATARGESGHGSIPRDDSAVVRLGEAIASIGRTRLPQHKTSVVEGYLKTLAAALPAPARWVIPQLLNPSLSGLILDRVLPDPGLARTLATSLSNTASPTVLAGGDKTNVIPAEASVELDGRTLPGQTAADLIRELEAIVCDDVRFDVIREAPPVETSPDTEVFRTIRKTLERADPGCVVIPYLMPGFTDAKAFHRLGTKWYGCSPVRLPQESEVRFSDLFHRPNERIPIAGFHWGLDVLDEIVREVIGT